MHPNLIPLSSIADSSTKYLIKATTLNIELYKFLKSFTTFILFYVHPIKLYYLMSCETCVLHITITESDQIQHGMYVNICKYFLIQTVNDAWLQKWNYHLLYIQKCIYEHKYGLYYNTRKAHFIWLVLCLVAMPK